MPKQVWLDEQTVVNYRLVDPKHLYNMKPLYIPNSRNVHSFWSEVGVSMQVQQHTESGIFYDSHDMYVSRIYCYLNNQHVSVAFC